MANGIKMGGGGGALGMIIKEFNASNVPIKIVYDYGNKDIVNAQAQNATSIIIKGNVLKQYAFGSAAYFTGTAVKAKILCTALEQYAVASAFYADAKVWISSKVTTAAKFVFNTKLTLYVEHVSIPAGFATSWNQSLTNGALTTYWGVSETSFDAL